MSNSFRKKFNQKYENILKWNRKAKVNGFELGDYISEFKIESSNRPNKAIIYPITIFLLIILVI